MKLFGKKTAAVKNPMTRQPVVPQRSGGLNSQMRPVANVPAIRNTIARQKG